jgi:hypothetical protein
MFLWIDPPGENPGWIHELPDTKPETLESVRSQYDIPEGNAARQETYDARHSGENTLTVEAYQRGRDFWGVTALSDLPDDLPDGITVVPIPKEQ